MKKHKKKWSVLIYNNGNNEFEPEIYKSMKLEGFKIDKNINIVVQISRLENTLIRIIRQDQKEQKSELLWAGTRRYFLQDNWQLIEMLGQKNMADPKTLYDFLCWGIKNYPAEKYMVLLGGHAIEYLGLMNDYSENLPCIMGIPEMAKVFYLVNKVTKTNINILVLDTCFMNSIEVLYELAHKKNNTVHTVLTFIRYGPWKGVSWKSITNILQKNIELREEDILKIIIEEIDLDLVAFRINNINLERLKKISHNFATKSNCNIYELLNDKEWIKNTQALTIAFKKIKQNNDNPLINLAHGKAKNKLADFYYRLAFSKNNKWSHYVNKKALSDLPKVQMKPLVLPLSSVVMLFSALYLDDMKLEEVLNKFFYYLNIRKNTIIE